MRTVFAPSARARRSVAPFTLTAAVVGVLLITQLREHHSWASTLTAVLTLGAVAVVTAVCWRCEHCRRYLGRGSGRGYCPNCGRPLD